MNHEGIVPLIRKHCQTFLHGYIPVGAAKHSSRFLFVARLLPAYCCFGRSGPLCTPTGALTGTRAR